MDLPVNYETLPPEQRRQVREEYVKQQNNYCCHCGASLSGKPDPQIREYRVDKSLFPKGFFRWPIHLHHCHNTGMTLGAVHNYCNAVLWQYYGE